MSRWTAESKANAVTLWNNFVTFSPVCADTVQNSACRSLDMAMASFSTSVRQDDSLTYKVLLCVCDRYLRFEIFTNYQQILFGSNQELQNSRKVDLQRLVQPPASVQQRLGSGKIEHHDHHVCIAIVGLADALETLVACCVPSVNRNENTRLL